MNTPFSVCLSVYKNDSFEYVRQAIDSVTIGQTCSPSEMVIVIDGPIGRELSEIIDGFEQDESIHIIRLPKNNGLGNALRIAVEYAKYDLIARMDSDDIALPERFEKQLRCFEEDKELSIVGGSITEFIDTPDNIVASRICPSTDKEIKKFMKSRCGFNHMTVMFKKTDVLRAGNYQDWHFNEDYYLWLRMMQHGCKFRNLEDVLVNVRVGKDMYARRGGWKYFKSEYFLQKYMWQQHIIGLFIFLYNVTGRFVVEVMMTNCLRAWIFQNLLRK